jgi:hypothetical protein
VNDFLPNNKKIKLAVCYHGPARSLRQLIDNHNDFIFNYLNKSGIEYNIFVHTWVFSGKQFIRDKPVAPPNDHTAFELLDPLIIKKDNQDTFLLTVNFEQYFDKQLWDKHGDNSEIGEWRPGLIKNYICSLESQKRVTDLITEDYTHIMYIRPDVRFRSNLDVSKIINLNDSEIVIPSYEHYEGLNDRFSILTNKTARVYGNRIDSLAEFRKNNGRIVSEKYTKHFIINNSLKPIFINLFFDIVRI